MKKSWTMAVAVAFGAGAAVAACGGGGSGNSGSGTTGTGASGHGGAGGSTSSTGTAGGFGFDSGIHDGALQDGDACGSVALVTKPTPGNLVVVFDQSDSMNQPYGTSGPKWQVARDAIAGAVTADQGLLNVGSIFFPTKATGNTCSLVDLIGTPPQINIEPGATFVTDFKAHFAAPGWTLILGTPLKDALDNANLALPDPSPLKGKRAVIIVTDGAPTCVTMQSLILAPVQAMATRGISTYAIGLPGSAGASTLLNAIAAAGGTGMYLSPADPASLQMALAQIASDTLDKCTVTLDPPPPDPSKVYLIVTDPGHPNGYQIPETDGGAGWNLSADGTTATLTGSVCAMAKSGGYSSIQFVYGCPVLP